jgi:Cu(I)/Ag(I) efflux system protein CusF
MRAIAKEFTMKRISMLTLFFVLLASALPVFAQSTGMSSKDAKGMDMKSTDMKGMEMDKKAAATTHHGVGVVKNVNTPDGVVTIVHEPIKSLNWPAMTMGFRLKDQSSMGKIKPGDKVEFAFVQVGKDYVITGMK